MVGICCDSENESGRPTADELFAAGADGIRVVARDSDSFFRYANDLLVSMKVAVVLARESFPTDEFSGFAAFYSERVTPHWWIVGNEEESWMLPEPSPSSWSLRPGPYAMLFKSCAEAILERQPDAQILLGGMVAGQPSILPAYLDEIRAIYAGPIAGLDVHPYGRDAESARALLREYGAILDAYGI